MEGVLREETTAKTALDKVTLGACLSFLADGCATPHLRHGS
jgi:hypothetical protein